MFQRYDIDNRKESAVTSSHWDPDKKDLVDKIQKSTTPRKLMQEVFLLYPDDVDTQNANEFKYPHHVLKDGKCFLSVEGVKSAYARLKQQNNYQGEAKEHIDRHRRELGMDKEEAELESITSDLERTFKSLQEALLHADDEPITESTNVFDLMMEKPTINPNPNGSPIQNTPNQTQQTPQQTQPITNDQQNTNPSLNTTDQTATIPVQNVDPTEDTLTNNPIEGPDDRDQDNLDGNARKEMYQNFANVMIQNNKSCVFGTIFDQDIFKSEYKIVPYEMRYFYRLQNPVSVEVGELRFIPFGTELLEAQEKYDLGKKMFVFATNNDKPIFFNQLDKTIWFNDDKLSDTFDGFIEQLIQSNGEINIPGDDQNQQQDADVQYAQDPNTTDQSIDTTQPTQDQPVEQGSEIQPVDLSQTGGAMTATTGLEDQSVPETNQGNDVAPVDLTQQNASYNPEDDSIINSMFESVHHVIKQAADTGNLRTLRNIFALALDDDPTFENYQEEYNYVRDKGLLEPHRELTPLTEDPAHWTEEYWVHLETDLRENFSEKRMEHMKRVAQVLLKEKIARLHTERSAKAKEISRAQEEKQKYDEYEKKWQEHRQEIKSQQEKEQRNLEEKKREIEKHNQEIEAMQQKKRMEITKKQEEILNDSSMSNDDKKALLIAGGVTGATAAAMILIWNKIKKKRKNKHEMNEEIISYGNEYDDSIIRLMEDTNGLDLFEEKATNPKLVKDFLKKKYKYDPAKRTIEIEGKKYDVELNKTPGYTAVVQHMFGDPTINLSPDFFLLSPKKAEGILLHELGHLNLQMRSGTDDTEKKRSNYLNEIKSKEVTGNNGHSNRFEYEADLYAAAKSGNKKRFIRALKTFLDKNKKFDNRMLYSTLSQLKDVDEEDIREIYNELSNHDTNVSALDFSSWVNSLPSFLKKQIDDARSASSNDIKRRKKALMSDTASKNMDTYKNITTSGENNNRKTVIVGAAQEILASGKKFTKKTLTEYLKANWYSDDAIKDIINEYGDHLSESIDDSIIFLMNEETAFPNDALIEKNKKREQERQKRLRGEYLAE